jgi:ankyrin repeat protein
MKRSLLTTFIVVGLLSAARSQDIFEAFRKGDIQAVKALIEKSPEVLDSRDAEGQTPLHYAAFGGDSALVNFLIDHGAKLELQDVRAKTPLHIAAMNDRKDVVAALLRRGAVVDVRDDYQRTALVLCARERGQIATARVLLDAGADVDAADKFDDTALSLAAWRGKSELVDLLIERGATTPVSGGKWQQLVPTAASKGLPKLFRRLTEKGQDLKADAELRASLLHDAARGGAVEIVEALLSKGFDPGARDISGWTPLHYAALDGRTEAARKLVESGAPLNARTIAGQTPWNVARERGMETVAGLLASKGADTGEARFPLLEGDYLGQKPPADEAEVFAIGIISSIWGLHSTAVFSPDGNEVYWAPMMSFPGEIYSRGGLLMMKRVRGHWTAPSWALFSGPDLDDDVPFFSVDGKRIYFISQRPMPGMESSEKERIWFADRTNGGWSTPRPLDPVINENDMHWEFSLDRERNLYLALRAEGGHGMGDIYCARFVNGKYEQPVNLGDVINSAADEATPFIASDGSYLLFSRAYDLWVSFRQKDGSWSAPVKFGPEVNSPGFELCPIVSADGKYLFFTSAREAGIHAYWVRADVIEKARLRSK